MTIKLKILPHFPSSVTASGPILLDKTGGNYTFSLDVGAVQKSISIPSDDLPFMDGTAAAGTSAAFARAGHVHPTPTTTRGDMIARGASSNGRLALGTSGYALLSNGTDPAWAGFLQSGTGAVTRTWQDKARDVVSVKDFGAKGDGTTDDAAAFQAAINYVLSLPVGGSVFIPNGVYAVGSTINVPLATNISFRLFGQGRSSQIKYTGASIVAVFNVGGASSMFGAFHEFRDFGFTPPTTAGTCISLQNVNTVSIEGVSFFNHVNGIILNSCFAVHINKCYFYGISQYGITDITTGTNNLIVSQCGFSTCGTAVNLQNGGNNIVIRDSDLEANSVSIALTNYTSVLIEGNYIEGGTSIVFFLGGTNRCVEIRQNWLGQNNVSTPLQNIVGGCFENNTLFSSAWTTTATDFVIGYNCILSGVTLAATRWTPPTLLNGFVTQSASYVPAGYLKKPDNTVVIRGDLFSGTAGTVIFNLPAGYRPLLFHTFCTASSAAPGASIVEVRTNGDVVCLSQAGGGTGLNGISFAAEA